MQYPWLISIPGVYVVGYDFDDTQILQPTFLPPETPDPWVLKQSVFKTRIS